jgi:hypothetical protein
VGGHDEPERAPDPADLLDRDRVGQGVHPGTAPALGDRDAEPAHLTQAVDDRAREPAGTLVLVDDRGDLALHEAANGRSQESVLGREVEIHGRRVSRKVGQAVARALG